LDLGMRIPKLTANNLVPGSESICRMPASRLDIPRALRLRFTPMKINPGYEAPEARQHIPHPSRAMCEARVRFEKTSFGYDCVYGEGISRDPSGERRGINLYGYVLNDPVNGIDLLGLDGQMGPPYLNQMPWANQPPAITLGPRGKEFVSGVNTMIMSGGAVAIGVPTAEAGVGIPLIIGGVISFDLGMTTVVHALSGAGPVGTPNGTIPGGSFELAGAMTGNPNMQTFGAMTDSLIPLPTDAWSILDAEGNIFLNPPDLDPNAWPFSSSQDHLTNELLSPNPGQKCP